ncbi:biotin--[acetyl-CoA-carboxylase] ligase [Flavobacteriaceae bacterium M23B6Z8]
MIIKLNAIDSTNAFLKRLIQEKELPDYTVVTAEKQMEGRGQMGTSWQSEPYKNLVASVFKRISCVESDSQFLLSIAVSLAVVRTLEHFKIPDLKIKWPNDILSANKKICGILIETLIKQGSMDAAIIGIGLNVNQVNFPGLPSATSMKIACGKEYELDEVRDQLLFQFTHFADSWSDHSIKNELEEMYLSYLFRYLKPSTFENTTGEKFMGFIEGVAKSGKLKIRLEDEVIKEFDIKEVKLLY